MNDLRQIRFSEAKRAATVQPPVIPIVAEWTRDNPGTISLGQGVVSWEPPATAYEGIDRFREDGENHKYKLAQGIPPLLDLIGEKLKVENGIELDPKDRVFVTAGANMAFLNAILAIADVGDEIILPAPFYFNHEMAVTMLGCNPVVVPTDSNHQLDLDALRSAISKRTRAIVTTSPNNPSGAVYPEEDLRAVTALCREFGLFHISDEAYEYFTFDGASHFSPGSAKDADEHVISLFSLSKAYGFASWRIGYMATPPQLIDAVKKIQDTNLICPPVVSQFAALEAMRTGRAYCEEKLVEVQNVRNLVMERLAGWEEFATTAPAKGAFYFLLKIKTDLKSLSVAQRLIEEYKVAVIPGSAFGLTKNCFLRIAYGVLDRSTCEEALDRLEKGLAAITS
jgi:aspartate/methionine/tyrosine aminotransferase